MMVMGLVVMMWMQPEMRMVCAVMEEVCMRDMNMTRSGSSTVATREGKCSVKSTPIALRFILVLVFCHPLIMRILARRSSSGRTSDSGARRDRRR